MDTSKCSPPHRHISITTLILTRFDHDLHWFISSPVSRYKMFTEGGQANEKRYLGGRPSKNSLIKKEIRLNCYEISLLQIRPVILQEVVAAFACEGDFASEVIDVLHHAELILVECLHALVVP